MLEASGEERVFLQGLIQVAVAFHHLRRGNLTGAARLLRAGVDKLAGCTAPRHPVDLPPLLRALQPLADQLEAGTVAQDAPAPEICWLPAR